MSEARNTSVKAIVFRARVGFMDDNGMGCLMPSMPYDYESVIRLYLAYPFLEYSLMIEVIIGRLLSKILPSRTK